MWTTIVVWRLINLYTFRPALIAFHKKTLTLLIHESLYYKSLFGSNTLSFQWSKQQKITYNHFYDSHDDIDWDKDEAYFIYYVVPSNLLITLFRMFSLLSSFFNCYYGRRQTIYMIAYAICIYYFIKLEGFLLPTQFFDCWTQIGIEFINHCIGNLKEYHIS